MSQPRRHFARFALIFSLLAAPLLAQSADAVFDSGFKALLPGSLLAGSLAPPDGSVLPADAIPVMAAEFVPPAAGPTVIVLRVDGIDVTALAELQSDRLRYTPASALSEGHHQIEVVIGTAADAVTSQWTFTTATAPEIRGQVPYFAVIAPGDPVEVRASYSDLGAGIDAAGVRLFEDQVEVTATATVTADAIHYARATPYAQGEHAIRLLVSDLAGNETSSEWSFTVGVAPELFDPAPEYNQLLPFGSAPLLALHYRSPDSALDPASLRFYLDAEDISDQATITATDPAQGVISVQLAQALAPGPHDVYVEVANATAVYGLAEWTFHVDDERRYQLTIRSPDDQAVVFDPTVSVSVAVQSNRDFPQTVLVNGERARFASQTDDQALYAASVALQPGANTLTATASFADGSSRSDQRQVTYEALPQVHITSPVDFSTLGPAVPASGAARAIAVTGTVSRPVLSVSVNQQPAVLSADGLGFSLDPYLLHEGDNLLSVVATDPFGRTSSASVAVYVDQTAPLLRIESPAADALTSNARIDVRGIVNDAIEGGVGAVDPLVEIGNAANQQSISASVSDRSFLATDVPLEVGTNVLTVSACRVPYAYERF